MQTKKQRKPRHYKAGQIVLISSEQYSDYSVHGFCRVLRDFELREVVGQWIAETKPKEGRYGNSMDSVSTFLHANGYVEDIDYSEIWLGGYGTIAEDIAPAEWPGATE